jgi:putative transposase
MAVKLNRGAHCVYSIKIHVVLVCKYRKHLLKDSIESDMKKFIRAISPSFGGTVEEIECDLNHCHLLVDLAHWQSPKIYVESVRAESTCLIWRLHKVILEKSLWKRIVFWSEGYCVVSTGGASAEVVANYIRKQKLKG